MGSVVVNLGDRNTANTMDEYMAEGAPHLRAIYALPHPGADIDKRHVALLANTARELILHGFKIPGVPGSSLSPTGAVLKAFAHLEGGPEPDPLLPLRTIE